MKEFFKTYLTITFIFIVASSSGQNVGVGNTTPLGKLHIKGSENNSQLIIDADSGQINISPLIKMRTSIGNDLLWIHSDTTFNAFIGVNAGRLNNPVAGGIFNTFIGRDAGYSNTTGNSNTANGVSSLFFNSLGNHNSAFGKEALYSNATGSYNTASGSAALFSNTGGFFNSAYGSAALYSNTSGSVNSAFGYAALLSNTTGYSNTAVGQSALYSNTAGSYNLAIGSNALFANTSGAFNSAIGNVALYSNTTGYNNTAQGSGALYSNTIGYQNTSAGISSLYDNTTGSENIANGYEALRHNITGNSNAAVGAGALRNNTTGHNNTALGDSSLHSNISGNKNTVIGYKANVDNGNLHNATAIGSNAVVSTSNAIVLGSVQGVNGASASANVGIGTTSPNPSSKLDVTSTTQGLLIPRMTSAQRKNIVAPAAGLLVYDLDKYSIYMYDGLKWNPLLYTTNEQKLPGYPVQASDGDLNDQFGTSVSINGDYALVGVSHNDIGSNIDQGSVYVFVRNSGLWQQQTILTPNTGQASDFFGCSVELNDGGDVAIIGALGTTVGGNTYQGCAYIFVRTGNTWTQQAKLTASDGTANDFYGSSVSIQNNYAIVGAPGDNSNTGSAYVYFKNGQWMDNQSHQSKITAFDGITFDKFGTDVSITEDYCVVGAPGNNGEIYIFNRSGTTWLHVAKIDGVNEQLGSSVSIDGDYIAAGCPGTNNKGAVRIYFRGNGWTNNQAPQATLVPSELINNDKFGTDVSISGDLVLGGAPQIFGGGTQGSSYLYKRTGSSWSLIRKFVDEFPQSDERFGGAVSVHTNNLIIGIPGKNNNTGEAQFNNIE